MMENYKYTGPTMIVKPKDDPDYYGYLLFPGNKVEAEVNIGEAAVSSAEVDTHEGEDSIRMIDIVPVYVSPKYLEPLKPETIHFSKEAVALLDRKPSKTVEDIICGDDTGYEAALKELYRDAPQGTYFIPKKFLDYLLNHGKEDSHDSHEIGGTHYGKMTIEPWDYIYANKLDFDSGNVVKYISRHKDKNGAEDVKKAISFCKHILKTQYGEEE